MSTRQAPAERVTRKPTGKPPWPITLLAGGEKAGKTYAAAVASSSDLIDRTFWIGVGEDDPDEYGAIPGARFEIVAHDGSYRDVIAAANWARRQPAADGRHNLIVIDSGTRYWDLLKGEAQLTANRRAKAKAERAKRPVPDEDVDITMDLWNTAKDRWAHLLDELRAHQGPSIITARLEQVTVMEGGKPTTEKEWKVQAEKSLPFDVGVIVEMPKRGETYLTGVRSLKFKPDEQHPERTSYPGFTVEKLWRDLGLAEKDATAPRQHASLELDDVNAARTDLAALCQANGWDLGAVNAEYMRQSEGTPIAKATAPAAIRAFAEWLQDPENWPPKQVAA